MVAAANYATGPVADLLRQALPLDSDRYAEENMNRLGRLP